MDFPFPCSLHTRTALLFTSLETSKVSFEGKGYWRSQNGYMAQIVTRCECMLISHWHMSTEIGLNYAEKLKNVAKTSRYTLEYADAISW